MLIQVIYGIFKALAGVILVAFLSQMEWKWSGSAV